jgi:hypothetical protein
MMARFARLRWRRQPGRHRRQEGGEFAARLRAALHDAADVIEPGPDGLARIRARTRPAGEYRPFHQPGCAARDGATPASSLRTGEDSPEPRPANVVTARYCTCPPERFAPGGQPLCEPGRGPGAAR